MITLGIETSCDETALALIETDAANGKRRYRIIAALVHSQADLHSAYGGVYPSLAKREHGKNLVPLLHQLLTEWSRIEKDARKDDWHKSRDEEFGNQIEPLLTELEGTNPDLFSSLREASYLKEIPPIDRIAVTEGPGLEPALWVGINFAKILGTLWQVPICPVNHMEGHIMGSLLDKDTPYGSWCDLRQIESPSVALLISGGHTELVEINTTDDGSFSYKIIGQTKDDAVGEAFDKVARLLRLPYPGGPWISKLSQEAAEQAIPSPVKLPRPMMKSGDLNFSFSGLKTAVLYAVGSHSGTDGKIDEQFKKGMAHEFETAVMETLDFKLRMAIEKTSARTVIIGGGVSANKALAEKFSRIAQEYNLPIYLPGKDTSGDNAIMIAIAGAFAGKAKENLKANGTKRLGTE